MDTQKHFTGLDFTVRHGEPEIQDPRIQHFFNYWLSLRKEESIPFKADVDPIDIPECLPYVWIYHFLSEEDNFMCDLAGEDINQTWNKSLRGCMISDIYELEHWRALRSRWLYALAHKAGLYCCVAQVGKIEAFERIALPLLDKDGQCTVIFGMTIYGNDGFRYSEYKPGIHEHDVTFYDLNTRD